jgi:hypothetical protein
MHLGAVSSGKASMICWAVQAALGCSVTLKWTTVSGLTTTRASAQQDQIRESPIRERCQCFLERRQNGAGGPLESSGWWREETGTTPVSSQKRTPSGWPGPRSAQRNSESPVSDRRRAELSLTAWPAVGLLRFSNHQYWHMCCPSPISAAKCRVWANLPLNAYAPASPGALGLRTPDRR